MADETLRFDIVGNDHASAAFSRAGESTGTLSRKMDIAARSAKALDAALERQRIASRVSVDATLALAKADDILAEAEHGLRDGALEAEFALKKEAEAARKSGDAAARAAGENRGLAASLAKIADSAKGKGGPGWLGPALVLAPAATTLGGVAAGAAVGLGGAAVAGAGALAAFGAVAKPVLGDAQKAAQAVEKAQNNYNIAIAHGTKQATAYKAEQVAIAKAYAELSPQQVALSKQLGNMAHAWQDLKAAETPVVAGALQPWLKSVTDLTGKLAPVIAHVSPVIHDLGVQFDGLVNSSAFRGFRDFVASTGTAAVSAVGSTLIDFVKGFIILLPKFDPLIREAVGWISRLGPAVLTWASSKKAADDITRFLQWFSKNGPVVGQLLKNIGGALKAMAPGLTSGGMAELQAMSAFFAFVAKLPPGVAKPLFEVAGALLLLNKLGVFSVGVKLIGMDAAKAAAAGGAAGMWGKLLPGVRLAGGALVAVVAVDMILKNTPSGAPGSGKNWWENPFGATSSHDKPGTKGTPSGLSSFDQLGKNIVNWWNITWNNTITRTAQGFHDIAHWFDTGRHWIAGSWGQTQHDTAHIWDLTWNNTVGRTQRGFHDVAGWFDWGRHFATGSFDQTRRQLASTWDTVWNNTVGRARRGIGDVMGWIGTLPGRVTGTFRSAGSWLVFGGANIITGLWNGIRAVWHGVAGWFAGLPSQILHALGIHSPPAWAIDAGKHVMGGLLKGLAHGAADVRGFFRGIAMSVTGPFKGIWSGLASAGKDVWHFLFGGPAGGAGGGVQRWASTVLQALKMEHLPAGLLGDVLYQMQTESGGNPFAQNNTDINAQMGTPSKGLLQVIDPTFRYWHWPGTSWNIFDPLANIAAALNYAAHGKGFGSGRGQIGSGHGYALGTSSAAAGWAWVGERGVPELVHFGGGEQVAPVRAGSGGRGGNTYIINIAPTPLARPADVGREVVGAIRAFEKGAGAGWRS